MARHKSPQKPQLLIVYNADGGVLNMLLHAAHKQFAPDSYPCSLCALTYGPVSMRGEWKRFLKSLPMDAVFHHRDDFADAYPNYGHDLPAILVADSNRRLRALIPASDLDAMDDLSDLIVEMESKLEAERVNMPFVRVSA
ncbi:hypothetical protein [Erythrobacter crassostreae]|uniref:GTPase n=1 Tax=Erythrobacter crassostreae TaxID=2828328 RepID=A0A9X1F0X1_9SPHN|nr:hypothetical protein [Erythrobacter crassostrea]MBV7258089.1 hypothetical protein [Erythrobacter crassostrea]